MPLSPDVASMVDEQINAGLAWDAAAITKAIELPQPDAPEWEGGGAGGIRTLDTLLTYTHFPGERLRPLGHRSASLAGPTR